MMNLENNKKYSYTLYHLYDKKQPAPQENFKKESSYYSTGSPYKQPQINTVYSHLSPQYNQPLKSQRERKLSSTYSSAMNDRQTYLKNPERESPITYPYKNPGCGINITGKAKFQMKGDQITVKIDKVLNSRKGGKSGTLQLQLIKMSYFYDGVSGMRPEEYTSVGTADLGELQGGWSFSDIVRIMKKKEDDEYTYRRCYILLLEEYDLGQFKIVDYLNFD